MRNVKIQIGQSNFRQTNKPILMATADRFYHNLIVGQTGTGKSTLINQLVTQDILRGSGLTLIDPHGDLICSIMGKLESEKFAIQPT